VGATVAEARLAAAGAAQHAPIRLPQAKREPEAEQAGVAAESQPRQEVRPPAALPGLLGESRRPSVGAVEVAHSAGALRAGSVLLALPQESTLESPARLLRSIHWTC